jgi:hypothetical protein
MVLAQYLRHHLVLIHAKATKKISNMLSLDGIAQEGKAYPRRRETCSYSYHCAGRSSGAST